MIDTAGRLHIDEGMMEELVQIKDAVSTVISFAGFSESSVVSSPIRRIISSFTIFITI